MDVDTSDLWACRSHHLIGNAWMITDLCRICGALRSSGLGWWDVLVEPEQIHRVVPLLDLP
jgi:hypothetical protein